MIDSQSIQSPLLQSLLYQVELAGATAVITDLTSTIGIPTYKCLISDRENWHGRPTAAGCGCHSSKEIALARAITEAAQSRVTVIAGSRDDIHPDSSTLGRIRMPGSPAMKSNSKRPIATLIDFETQPELAFTPTFAEEIQQTLSCLSTQGFKQAVFVNHTRPEYGIPVVHVIDCTGYASPFVFLKFNMHSNYLEPSQILIFLGPTLSVTQASQILPARYLDPVRCGDILACLRLQSRVIAIIDGFFDRSASVWHKEILWALEAGVRVFGASSMGALRAAKLEAFGMEGFGAIFAAF